MKILKTIIICCVTLCLLLSFGVSTGFAEDEQEVSEEVNQGDEAEQLSEIEELREKNSKTYLLSDGTYQYVGYAEDIHYKDTEGNLKEINNAITDKPAKEGYTYSNIANAWYTYFADSLYEKDAVVLEKDNYKITFSMVDAKSDSKVAKSSTLDISESTFDELLAEDNRAVVYKDALKNVDVAYTVRTSGLKEDIILRDASAPNVFEFNITVEGLSISEEEGIIFANSEGQNVFQLAPMYMEDANGKYSDEVEYTIEKSENDYRITIIADKEFLNEPDTQYPVIIDPSVMVTGPSDTWDTCVDQEYPTSHYYLSENLWTGGELGNNAMRTYMKFDLPTNIPAANVTSAYLRIKKRAYETPGIKAYRVTEYWVSSDVSWNDKPNYTTTYGSTTANNDSGNWYKMNTTTIVKKWLDGVYRNYGFCLKEPTETDEDQKTKYYSSDAPYPNRPELVVNFSSHSYYGNRPYEYSSGDGQNCMGYAINYPDYITGIDLGMTNSYLNSISTTSQLLKYIKRKSQTYMSDRSVDYDSLATYNSYIYSDQYRVVLRAGYIDLNSDGDFDNASGYGDPWDYHWWYQTNTGQWAEKLASNTSHKISGTSGSTNPYNQIWQNGNLYYNSACVYYAIDN